MPVSARDEKGKLLPEINAGPRGELGAGDRKVQAYNFRMCLSKDKNNQASYPKPPGYDPRRYTLLARLVQGLEKRDGRPPRMNELLIVSLMPNNKTDINNQGDFPTDYIGKAGNRSFASSETACQQPKCRVAKAPRKSRRAQPGAASPASTSSSRPRRTAPPRFQANTEKSDPS